MHVEALSTDVAGVELFDLRDMGAISQDIIGSSGRFLALPLLKQATVQSQIMVRR